MWHWTITCRYNIPAKTYVTGGICIGKLTSGNVHMKQNYALQQEQLEQGNVLWRQAHPLNNDVTIKVGKR